MFPQNTDPTVRSRFGAKQSWQLGIGNDIGSTFKLFLTFAKDSFFAAVIRAKLLDKLHVL